MRDYKQAYRDHKYGAKSRNIEFLLTFEEWLQIWIDSGHIDERGRSLHQYQMARFGDRGPYAVGNVRIITCAENKKEFVFTDEQLKKISEGTKGKKKGISLSESTKKKMSNSKIGKPMSKIQKENWLASMTPEVRIKNGKSISASYHNKSEEQKEARKKKISEKLTGRKLSNQHKKSISDRRRIFNDQMVREIKQQYVPYKKGHTAADLAKKYNVKECAIWGALNRKDVI